LYYPDTTARGRTDTWFAPNGKKSRRAEASRLSRRRNVAQRRYVSPKPPDRVRGAGVAVMTLTGRIPLCRQPRYPGNDFQGPEVLRPRLTAGMPLSASTLWVAVLPVVAGPTLHCDRRSSPQPWGQSPAWRNVGQL